MTKGIIGKKGIYGVEVIEVVSIIVNGWVNVKNVKGIVFKVNFNYIEFI